MLNATLTIYILSPDTNVLKDNIYKRRIHAHYPVHV